MRAGHLCGQSSLAPRVRREGWARKKPCWGQVLALGARRWPLCHLWTQGRVQAWPRVKDALRYQGQPGPFLALTQRTEGTCKHSQPHRWASKGEPPGAVVPSWEPGFHRAGSRSPCQAAALPATLHVPSKTWAFPGRGHRPGPSEAAAAAANQLFRGSGRAPAGFVCIESAGSVPPAPAGTEGQRGEQGGVLGRGRRLEMRGWRGLGGGWTEGRTLATPAWRVGTRQPKVAAAAAGKGMFPGEKAGGGG